MIKTSDVLNLANSLMQERYHENIRSRQIRVLAEALVIVINKHLSSLQNNRKSKTKIIHKNRNYQNLSKFKI